MRFSILLCLAGVLLALKPVCALAQSYDYPGTVGGGWCEPGGGSAAAALSVLPSLPSVPPPDGGSPESPSGLPGNAPYFDLDAYLAGPGRDLPAAQQIWRLQVLPSGLIYRTYLAGPKEPRLASHLVHLRHDGWVWDAAVGGRVGLLRYGTAERFRPVGFQIDAEGAGQARLDIGEDVDLRSADFRGGVALTYGDKRRQTKLAYYHISSHAGDEFLLSHPAFVRVNYSRDVLVLGHSIYVTDQLRIYGEAGWAFHSDVSEPWEFQFGADYAPAGPTGLRGAPFFAINGAMRQEVNFGGGVMAQAGWAWRSGDGDQLLRIGLQYYNGESTQFEFFDDHEEQLGLGVWYDF